MSAIIVKHLCKQLTSKAALEIRNHLDCDLLFSGVVAEIPLELMFLDVVKFEKRNNKYIIYIC
ncbi:MAG: hypothetical protein ACI4MA_02665 [Treponema sp.]